MASRGTGTLILVCLLWLFFLCATIAFLQLNFVDKGTTNNNPSSRSSNFIATQQHSAVRIHLSASLFLQFLLSLLTPFPCSVGYPFGTGFGGCHPQGVFWYSDPWQISGYASFLIKYDFLCVSMLCICWIMAIIFGQWFGIW